MNLFLEKLPNLSLLLFWQINATFVASTLLWFNWTLVLGEKCCLKTPCEETQPRPCPVILPVTAEVLPVMTSTFDAWAISVITEVTHDVISNTNVPDSYSGIELTQQFQRRRVETIRYSQAELPLCPDQVMMAVKWLQITQTMVCARKWEETRQKLYSTMLWLAEAFWQKWNCFIYPLPPGFSQKTAESK